MFIDKNVVKGYTGIGPLYHDAEQSRVKIAQSQEAWCLKEETVHKFREDPR